MKFSLKSGGTVGFLMFFYTRQSVGTRMQDAGGAPAPSGLLDQMPSIDECFSSDSIQEVYAALTRRKDAWSRETLDSLNK